MYTVNPKAIMKELQLNKPTKEMCCNNKKHSSDQKERKKLNKEHMGICKIISKVISTPNVNGLNSQLRCRGCQTG